MAERKACFFDIDGTIWNEKNEIPESAVKAIRRLRENGHLAFLCSGRCRGYIREPNLLGIGFDGIVAGCGTEILFGDRSVFYHRIDPKLMEWAIVTCRSCGFRPILEGREYMYMDDAEFAHEFYGKKLKADAGDRLKTIEGEWGRWEVSKFSCATDNADRETCFRLLSKDFDFMIHNEAVAEIVPKGFHKGTGLRKVCDLLGMDPADTFAFGDSNNDIGMMEAAGTSVAMGNGQDSVKKLADYVTTPMFEDGIWNACSYFGLL